MAKDLIGYEEIIQDAMRGVVRETLRRVSADGLPPGHQLYLTFRTDRSDVALPDSVRAAHPRDITIVLQNQFWDLAVEDDHFSVMLSFNKMPATVVVPFDSLLGFADPGANFGLQFRGASDAASDQPAGEGNDEGAPAPGDDTPALDVVEARAESAAEGPVQPAQDDGDSANVVSFDKFRRK